MSSFNPKFSPSEKALEICNDIFDRWMIKHNIKLRGSSGDNASALSYKIASRINSWISPKSVVYGVSDLVQPSVESVEQHASIEDLGNMLGAKLMEEDMLVASPRRGGGIGSK